MCGIVRVALRSIMNFEILPYEIKQHIGIMLMRATLHDDPVVEWYFLWISTRSRDPQRHLRMARIEKAKSRWVGHITWWSAPQFKPQEVSVSARMLVDQLMRATPTRKKEAKRRRIVGE